MRQTCALYYDSTIISITNNNPDPDEFISMSEINLIPFGRYPEYPEAGYLYNKSRRKGLREIRNNDVTNK